MQRFKASRMCKRLLPTLWWSGRRSMANGFRLVRRQWRHGTLPKFQRSYARFASLNATQRASLASAFSSNPSIVRFASFGLRVAQQRGFFSKSDRDSDSDRGGRKTWGGILHKMDEEDKRQVREMFGDMKDRRTDGLSGWDDGTHESSHWRVSERKGMELLWLLIGINVGVFLYFNSICSEKQLTNYWDHFTASNYNLDQGRYHTLITSAFAHAGLFHLVANMVGLYVFGSMLAPAIGWPSFLGLYLVAGAVASYASTALQRNVYRPRFEHELKKSEFKVEVADYDNVQSPKEVPFVKSKTPSRKGRNFSSWRFDEEEGQWVKVDGPESHQSYALAGGGTGRGDGDESNGEGVRGAIAQRVMRSKLIEAASAQAEQDRVAPRDGFVYDRKQRAWVKADSAAHMRLQSELESQKESLEWSNSETFTDISGEGEQLDDFPGERFDVEIEKANAIQEAPENELQVEIDPVVQLRSVDDVFQLDHGLTGYLWDTPGLGASGSIMGVMTAQVLLEPQRLFMLLGFIPIRSWMILAGLTASSLVGVMAQMNGADSSGIGHTAHLVGSVVGAAWRLAL